MAGLSDPERGWTVVGVFDDAERARSAVEALDERGWPPEQVSLARRGPGEAAPTVTSAETAAPQGAAVGSVAGAIGGAILGVTAVAVPGAGALLAAGPLLAALTGAAAGGAVGGLLGSFAGLGIPDEHAREYGAAVEAGGTFVAVPVEDDQAAERARDLLRAEGARVTNSYPPRA